MVLAAALAFAAASSVSGAVLADVAQPPHGPARGARAEPSLVPARRTARRSVIGRSVDGRKIYAIHLSGSNPERTVLVVGCIHGDEPAGIAIARRLAAARAPRATSLWIIPDLNPDGVSADTRQNADGVDLNRNFPWHWRRRGARGDVQYPGPHPLSEPEARAAARLIKRIRPDITIWFHQHLALVDLSGGNLRIERKYARLVGLPTRRLTRYRGSAINWENALLPHGTAFDVELPPGSLSKPAVRRYARAVSRLAQAP